MNIDSIENISMLMAFIIALLASLFRYIEIPRKGYLCMCAFFLAHILSDYYWAVYTLAMGENPDISAFLAYLGWNIGYVILAVTSFFIREKGSERYFHPLMLVPIPINIIQFMIYIQFGGLFNNIWQVSLVTVVACMNLQQILYYEKNKKDGAHFSHLHLFMLMFVTSEIGMWTSSCYFWSGDLRNPYYYFAFANYVIAIFLPWAASRDYVARGMVPPERNADEIRFQVRIQVIVSVIIISGLVAGYYFATWMRSKLPEGSEDLSTFNTIAVILLVFSLFIDIIMIGVMYLISIRYKETLKEKKEVVNEERSRVNLVITLMVSFGLMLFGVIYTSRMFYKVSVTGLYESGEAKAESSAATLENYIVHAQSTLKVTADTVDIMVSQKEPQDKIRDYILEETDRQKSELDENFTGLYGFVNGEYMDGLAWVPPEGYDPTQRDWYKEAVAAGGDVHIVSPYLDAQTKSIVITIGRMLDANSDKDEKNVVALDVRVNRIQEITEGVDIGGKGYAFIVNNDGMIISHRDQSLVGKNLTQIWDEDVLPLLTQSDQTLVKTKLNEIDNTMFVYPIMDQWYFVITVADTKLFEEVNSQLMVNIIVSAILFALISTFYYIGYKNEQAYGKQVEDMKIGRQKQEYEAEVLRLEKLASDEANKAKSDFLADMSHEIRTPINAILGMNEMILRETKETGTLEYARNIKTSGRNLLQLVNSILDFSKIEDGKMEIVPVRYSLSTLITYLINSVQERVMAKKLELNVDIDPNLPSEMYGDDARIDQIILNLLTNAVKYTPKGSVTLTVKEQRRENDNILLYVEVKDTGIGIKENDMERLFESFERLDKVRNRNIEGTGLGIAITTKLLALMDSELMVESKYGEGSVFSFELWQRIENAEPIGEYRMTSITPKDFGTYHESFHAPDARILVVDDTKMNIMVVVNLLKETKMKIDTALNGSEAVKLCENSEYDVILLDQRMPGMDGTQTLKEIRALASALNKDTPVICLTADAIRGAKERYIAEGFSDYLTKPVSGRDLEHMLIRYLPKEKIGRGGDDRSDGEKKESAVSDKAILALKDAGLDTDEGMRYCGNDEKLYRSLLIEFATEHGRKRPKIDQCKNDKNWNDYSILIHSVKSSAKMLGAAKLSQIAASLESASKNEDEISIMNANDDAMRMYDVLTMLIKENFDVPQEDDQDADEDVLEFGPAGE